MTEEIKITEKDGAVFLTCRVMSIEFKPVDTLIDADKYEIHLKTRPIVTISGPSLFAAKNPKDVIKGSFVSGLHNLIRLLESVTKEYEAMK